MVHSTRRRERCGSVVGIAHWLSAQLERQLRARPAAEPQVEVRTERVEVPVLSRDQTEALVLMATDAGGYARELARVADSLSEASRTILEALNGNADQRRRLAPNPRETVTVAEAGRLAVPRIAPVPRAHRRPPPHSPAPRPADSARNPDATDGAVTAPQQRILDALSSFEAAGLRDVARSNVAVFSDHSSASSGYANNLGALRSRGLIEYPAQGRVALTDAGRALAAAAQPIRSLEELHQAWQRKLSAPQWRILEVLTGAYPQSIARDELAERAYQSPRSSGYANNLGSLRSLGLIDYPSQGHVAATELLFPRLPAR